MHQHDAVSSVRRRYAEPRVTDYGTVAQLTQGKPAGGGGGGSTGGGGSKPKPPRS